MSENRESAVALARNTTAGLGYAVLKGRFCAPELAKAAEHPDGALVLVRELLHTWGLDIAHYGTKRWNPLGALIPAGSRVLLKPNWVYHAARPGGSLDALITHTSVIRAVLEYVALARPSAVIVGDAPLQSCDFEALSKMADLTSLIAWSHRSGVPLEIVDFRRTVNPGGRPGATRDEDARGLENFVLFDLGDESSLKPLDGDSSKFRVTAYDPGLMASTHHLGRHKYLIAREALEADVVVNLPKLKCHMKACITGALKNLVGINGHKEYLPHHRKGGAGGGGDCYPGSPLWKRIAEEGLDIANGHGAGRVFRYGMGRALAAARKFAAFSGADANLEGSWHGNDTIWRTALDLNRVLQYGSIEGRLQSSPQRTVIHITDAIIAGEGDGPLKPTPVAAGFITGAVTAAAADYVHARLMGFDPERIPIIRGAFKAHSRPLVNFSQADVVVRSCGREVQGRELQPIRFFVPPSGWLGHCELAAENAPVETHLASV